jgi:hypothetical protein
VATVAATMATMFSSFTPFLAAPFMLFSASAGLHI